ncbi:substrate-binding domain-containing protein [Enterovibrio norvegicus]|uniref:substrate-binding domain-containing protein n=1 Tax=Enterovibrio norvegicus TaxID=188144 RepID=UPI0013D712CD|nr:substrate-binding domain-containing protein [Enterovibrio norvegicus]
MKHFLNRFGVFIAFLLAFMSPAQATSESITTGFSFKEKVTVGISVFDLSNPFFVTMVRSIRDELTVIYGEPPHLLVRSSGHMFERQERQLAEFIAEGADMIFLVASDEHRLKPTIQRAISQNIPVIAVDAHAMGSSASITTDNVQAGEIACQRLAEHLDNQGDIVILNGPAVSSVIERVEGCKRALLGTEVNILSDELNATGSYEGGLETMAYALQAFERIDGVFAINDPSALGAEQALKQAGADAVLVSVDGSPKVREALQQKRQWWLATATQFPDRMSREAVRIGHQIRKNGVLSNTHKLIPTELIDNQNVHQFVRW